MKTWLRIALGGLLVLALLPAAFLATLDTCVDSLPYVHPLPIRSAGLLYVETNRGRLFTGQTYRYRNDGPWVGSVTVLLAWPGRAVLLVRHREGSGRATCWETYP